MNKQRTILRNLKANYKEELTSLKHYTRELSRRCKEHHTGHEHTDPDLMKAKHDTEYYKNAIKDITARLKELSSK